MERVRPIAERASMRPGQSCPGVGAGVWSARGRDVGFNEAGAIMPRSGLGSLDAIQSRLNSLQ